MGRALVLCRRSAPAHVGTWRSPSSQAPRWRQRQLVRYHQPSPVPSPPLWSKLGSASPQLTLQGLPAVVLDSRDLSLCKRSETARSTAPRVTATLPTELPSARTSKPGLRRDPLDTPTSG